MPGKRLRSTSNNNDVGCGGVEAVVVRNGAAAAAAGYGLESGWLNWWGVIRTVFALLN